MHSRRIPNDYAEDVSGIFKSLRAGLDLTAVLNRWGRIGRKAIGRESPLKVRHVTQSDDVLCH